MKVEAQVVEVEGLVDVGVVLKVEGVLIGVTLEVC
jgi:hypothetical protein